MLRFTVLFPLIIIAVSSAGNTMISDDFSYSIPHYSVRLGNINHIDIRMLEDHGFLIEWAHGDKATLYVNADQEEMLRHLGFKPIHIPIPEPLIPYPSLSDIYDSAAQIASDHSDICVLDTIGFSVQDRPILAVIVSDNPGVEEIEPELRIHGGIHGNEPIATTVTLCYLNKLTEGYASDPACQCIVNNSETWIIPVLNPDGYYSNSRYNANGIDLNRNCSYMGPGGGGGSTAFSEPETAALRDLTMQNWPDIVNFINPFSTGLSLHSGAQCINTVWNYTVNPLPEDYDLLDAQCNSYANDPGIISYFGSGGAFWIALPGASWYVINGDVNDWSYGECGTVDYTIETHDTFAPSDWPDVNIAHYYAILDFFTTSTYGIWGTVTNISGDPLDAMISIGFSDGMDSEALRFCRTDVTLGDYHKTLIPDTYDVEVYVDGYESQSITDVAVGSEERVEVSFVLYNVGIEDSETGNIQTERLSVYPNPAHGSLNISMPVTGVGGTVAIYDITGRSVYSQDISAEVETLLWNCTEHNGSEVPSGMYIVRFNSGNSSWTARFMVNR
ncbi:MAG: T9SS type A sorting domain-containing protein [Candidatus Aegiribacteria sp.]|nr:T9SS type A sorting domain-containing protein [Candidatus Aegiribacteria sp.]